VVLGEFSAESLRLEGVATEDLSCSSVQKMGNKSVWLAAAHVVVSNWALVVTIKWFGGVL
jgi:hypothetical protein